MMLQKQTEEAEKDEKETYTITLENGLTGRHYKD